MIAVYCVVSGSKLPLYRKSLKMLHTGAGERFDLYVVYNGNDNETVKWLRHEKAAGRVQWLKLAGKNYGQNIAANWALDEIYRHHYDYVMRWDPDALPRTRRFLSKLRKRANAFRRAGAFVVLSPKITKLKHPPEPYGTGEDVGFEYEAVEILGGICRLHPYEFFRGWRFNKFGALGFGEALEVAERARDLGMALVRVPSIEVEHAYGEDGQRERWPEDFTWERKMVARYVGYGL